MSYTSIVGNKVEIEVSGNVSYKYNKESIYPLIRCPITTEYFKDPVLLLSEGSDVFPYEKAAIAKWLRRSNVDPVNGGNLKETVSIHNFYLIY